MKICYIQKEFTASHLQVIGGVNRVIDEYNQQGFKLTLRSLYYQFVARGWFKENTASQYNRLGNIVNDGRLAGLIDWDAIEDNLRALEGLPTSSGPKESMLEMRKGFRHELWANQPWQPEVWVEKDAMMGVIEGICNDLRVNMFACRGYASQSSMWRAGQRMASYVRQGKRPIVFHLGDHDPSGIDMTRDNEERLSLFAGVPIQVVRLALNFPQVQRYNPPENFAKPTDSRFASYVSKFGEHCWELDALHPAVIRELIESAVLRVRDQKLWEEALAAEAEDLDTIDQLMEQQGWKSDEEE
jgi:hypothetical protein